MKDGINVPIFLVVIVAAGIFLLKPVTQHFADLFPDQASKEEKRNVGKVPGANPRVEEVQEMLKELKFYAGPVDGKMGKETRNALAAFQKKNNIAATGKVDLKTLNGLRKQTSVWFEDSKPPVKNKDGSSDSKNSYDIKTIQLLLKSAGFYKGKIDGKMGPETVKAIKRFQRSKNLKASGIINFKTWEKLKKF